MPRRGTGRTREWTHPDVLRLKWEEGDEDVHQAQHLLRVHRILRVAQLSAALAVAAVQLQRRTPQDSAIHLLYTMSFSDRCVSSGDSLSRLPALCSSFIRCGLPVFASRMMIDLDAVTLAAMPLSKSWRSRFLLSQSILSYSSMTSTDSGRRLRWLTREVRSRLDCKLRSLCKAHPFVSGLPNSQHCCSHRDAPRGSPCRRRRGSRGTRCRLPMWRQGRQHLLGGPWL